MSNLVKLQRQFQQYIEGENEQIIEHIVTTQDAIAEHRLGAYYNAYRARLIEALAFDFPACQALLGEEKFAYLVIAYIKKYPSSYPSVRWVGKNLVAFIIEQESFEKQAFLAELALFEWHQSLVFDSKDQPTLFQLEDMTFPPEQWPELSFQFISGLQKIDLYFNVSQFWQAVEDETEFPDINKDEHPTQWLLWRQQLDPHWRSLDVHEAWALEQAQNGANFGTICEGLMEWIDAEHVALVAAGFLKQWISDQLIINIQNQTETNIR